MHVEVTVFTKCFLLDVGFSSFLPLMFSLPAQAQQVQEVGLKIRFYSVQ